MPNHLRRCATLAARIIFGWALILSYAGYVVVEWVRQRRTDG